MKVSVRRFMVFLFVVMLLGGMGSLILPLRAVHLTLAAGSGVTLALSPTSGHPSSTPNLTGSGFGATETVSITYDGTALSTTTTSASGTFSVNVTIPSSALPGTHQIQASGQTSHLTAQATFLVRTNWAYDGFDKKRTHDNPYENVIGTTNVAQLVLDWQFQTQNTISTTPVVADGILYLTSSDQYLYALDAQTGFLKWKFLLGQWPNSPVVLDGIVYASGEAGPLYALDAQTGQQQWNFTPMTGGVFGEIMSIAFCKDEELCMQELAKSIFTRFPLGSIHPRGCLLAQLQTQAQGLTGHLDEFWPDVADSEWIGGHAESWERAPYWLDGLVPLAFLLQDDRLLGKVHRWINFILDHQQEDGWLGPVQDATYGYAYDPWSVSIFLKALAQDQEATAVPRVIPAMQRFLVGLQARLVR